MPNREMMKLPSRPILAEIAQDLTGGRISDTVKLDFFQLLKLRYASLLSYGGNPNHGFYNQLIVWD